ncbi:protein B4 isoform X1 [Hippocampus zosterae]|uniref:protein B4 isoform X1 n=1 Tax=Hippocampus zosterae TaxID=109293 RepID=UPI00223DFA95|nr:protein B4 isoform X1 [Hippocampus zosterae]
MPPKRRTFVLNEVTAARNSPVPSKLARKSGVVTLRKMAMHPGTSVMVVEALKELDSRKGVSKQAIQNFIKRKYPSVDKIRLKYYVRRALRKGLDDGTLVRRPDSTVTTGVVEKFRLAAKRKESKAKVEPRVQKAAEVEPRVQKAAKVENVEPNVQKSSKAAEVEPNVQKSSKVAKEAPKTKAGRTKKAAADDPVKPPKKKATKGSDKSEEDKEAPPSKVPPAKKSKGKKAANETVEAKGTVRAKAKPKEVKEAVADGKTKAKPKEAKGKAEAAPKSAPKKGRKKNAE